MILCRGVKSCKLSAILATTFLVAFMSCAIFKGAFINTKSSFLTLSSYLGAASMVSPILVLMVSAPSSASMNVTTFAARTGPSRLTRSNISAQCLVQLWSDVPCPLATLGPLGQDTEIFPWWLQNMGGYWGFILSENMQTMYGTFGALGDGVAWCFIRNSLAFAWSWILGGLLSSLSLSFTMPVLLSADTFVWDWIEPCPEP